MLKEIERLRVMVCVGIIEKKYCFVCRDQEITDAQRESDFVRTSECIKMILHACRDKFYKCDRAGFSGNPT